MVCIVVLLWGGGGWVMSQTKMFHLEKMFRLEKNVGNYRQPLTAIYTKFCTFQNFLQYCISAYAPYTNLIVFIIKILHKFLFANTVNGHNHGPGKIGKKKYLFKSIIKVV